MTTSISSEAVLKIERDNKVNKIIGGQTDKMGYRADHR